jgi:copper oxidase (laccase) domain-containing protein
MNPDFSFVNCNEITLLVFTPWWQRGLIHGMTTSEFEFKGAELDHSVQKLCRAIGATDLALAHQSHGADLLDLRSIHSRVAMKAQYGDLVRRSEADALVAPASEDYSTTPTAYGVMSADCVPIIVRSTDSYLLIHAGWRGLANGVIGAALNHAPGGLEAVVFACAGATRYEVGPEVIEAIGDSAVYHELASGGSRYLLDTSATAIKQLRRSCPTIQAHSAQVCTISDHRFHSFRRAGEAAGRCVTFVLPPARVICD